MSQQQQRRHLRMDVKEQQQQHIDASPSSSSSGDDGEDEVDGEEISLAEARRPYQMAMMMANHDEHNNSSNNNDGDGNARKGKKRGTCGGYWNAQYCLLFLPRFLTHFGILLLIVGYICAIAITYYHIEGENEKMERVKSAMAIELAQRNLLVTLHNLAPHIPLDTLYQETEQFSQQLLALGWSRGRVGIPLPASTFAAAQTGWTQQRAKGMGGRGGGGNTKSGGQQHNNNSSTNGIGTEMPLWSFVNSMLFATSLVARIGYGHLVPITPLGKLLMFPFALLGIPLFLFAINTIGKLFTIDLSLATGCHRCFLMRKRKKNHQTADQQQHQQQQQQSEEHALEGGAKSSDVGVEEQANKKRRRRDEKREENQEGKSLDNLGRTTLIKLLIMFLLAWALFAFVYSQLEVHWHWLDCFYFVFGTMCSIGFGDFAPSTELSTIVTICLIFPALALAYACIDLIVTKYIRTFYLIKTLSICVWKWTGRKLMNRRKKKTKTTTKTTMANNSNTTIKSRAAKTQRI